MKSISFTSYIVVCLVVTAGLASAQTCSDGQRPWKEADGTLRKCGDSEDLAKCPGGYSCQSSGICCPLSSDNQQSSSSSASSSKSNSSQTAKPDSFYCGPDQKPLTKPDRSVYECSQTDDDCLPPAECGAKGYCCLQPLNQEPPPVGCPFGSRPLTNSNGQEITCVPGKPGACPGSTTCYQDALTSTYHCCGKDPGEGCPSGSRALKVNGRIQPCTPGSTNQMCAGSAMCQWSYIIDRYQCCEPDDGCPAGMKPLMSASSSPQSCKSDGSAPCPANFACHFNFWTASEQCCGSDIGFCPAGQVPYLETATGQPRQCTPSLTGSCPSGYTCSRSSTGQNVCCGQAGQCPASMALVTDAQGRAQACSPSTSNGGCSQTATCQRAVGTLNTQYLCCTYNGPSTTTCQSGRQAVPSMASPQRCLLSLPGTCPFGSVCESSNIAGTYICCSTSVTPPSTNNVCPSGWTMANNVLMYCSPTSQICQTGGTCLQHQTINNQFVCCQPGNAVQPAAQYTCPVGSPVLLNNGQTHQFCGIAGAQCSSGSVCQQASNAPGTYVCCIPSYSSSYTCPGSGSPYRVGNQYQFCTITASQQCAPGYSCQQATNVNVASPVYICCSGTGAAGAQYQCAGMGTPVVTGQANTNQYCSPNAINTCIAGATCQTAANNPLVSICCYGNTNNQQTALRCGNGATPYTSGGQNVYCNLFQYPSTCPTGNECQAAIGGASTTTGICCNAGTAPSTYTCPVQYQPFIATNNQPIFCNQQNPINCPSGTSCLPAQNAPQYMICCQPAGGAQLCPTGQQALLLANQQPQYCNSPADTCVATGYSCQVSPTLSRYICCGQPGQIQARCANSQPFYPQASGQPMVCNPVAPGTCPNGYDCSPSTLNTQYVCCLRPYTLTPDSCQSGRTPYKPTGTTTLMTCTPGSTFCPPGTLCEQSNVSNQYICCNAATANNAQCPNGWNPYLQGTAPQSCQRIGDTTCPSGYSCTQSNIQGTFLCCQFSSGATTLRCANNAQAYNNYNNQPQVCNPSISSCPAGYSCQASNQPAQFICCAGDSGSSTARCSNGQSAQQAFNGQPQVCQPGSSSSACNAGYACQPSTQSGTSLCCQSTAALRCASGTAPYLNAQNLPAVCLSSAACNNGYSCQESTQSGTYICCSTTNTNNNQNVKCSNGQAPYQSINGSPQFCASPGSQSSCPLGYQCSTSTQSGVNVCCITQPTNNNLCSSGAIPSYIGSQPQSCVSSVTCPAGYSCQSSPSNPGISYCCQGPRCPSGVTINPTVCQPSQPNSCSSGFACTQSTNIASTYVCCNSFSGSTGSARCIGRGTLMTGGLATSCSANSCPSGYECSAYSTTGQYICCNIVRDQAAPVCPNRRELYRDPSTQQPMYCDSTNYECADGYVCKQMLNSDGGQRYVCCSEIPSCQTGWLPFKDRSTGQNQQCSPYGVTASCSPTPGWPYKCQQSTVPGTYLCCMESQFAKFVDGDLNDADDNDNEDDRSTASPSDATPATGTSPEWVTWAPVVQIEDPSGRWLSIDPEQDAPDLPEAILHTPDADGDSTNDDEDWVMWRPDGGETE